MLVVLLGFLVVMLIGAFLLALPISNKDGQWLGFTDAMFTSASAVCVTGLIVRPTSVCFNGFGQTVLLILIQIGGLGIMTLATLVFIMIGKRITFKDRVALQEALGQDHIKGIVRLVRNIVIMTGIIEGVGIIMLIPFFCIKNGVIGIWQAVFVSISAFCNAGFDILGTAEAPYASLTEFNGNVGVLLIIGALITLGGLGFTVIHDIISNKFHIRRYKPHTKIVLIASSTLFLFGTFFFLCSEFKSPAFAGMNGGQKLLNSIFQSITSRTAGFNAVDQNSMSQSGRIITCILMFIGASPGGTGGGIKTTTFAILLLMGWSGLRGKEEILVFKRTVKTKTGFRAVAISMLASILIAIITLIVSATDGLPSDYILYDVISAFATVGLSTGICPMLSTLAKWLFILIMFIGRLGPLSVGMIFTKQDRSSLKFPTANIMIG